MRNILGPVICISFAVIPSSLSYSACVFCRGGALSIDKPLDRGGGLSIDKPFDKGGALSIDKPFDKGRRTAEIFAQERCVTRLFGGLVGDAHALFHDATSSV